ncbi:hypothetical protein ACTQW9_13560 [Lachnospiraceae bacterium LCP19S3_B12]
MKYPAQAEYFTPRTAAGRFMWSSGGCFLPFLGADSGLQENVSYEARAIHMYTLEYENGWGISRK